ncbi:signal recognition particle-docking protein FtsY [Dysosmobacter sp. NSJ-60]|nr:signal recognition particle-docking protein FtsY [Dysosmobacter hominis]
MGRNFLGTEKQGKRTSAMGFFDKLKKITTNLFSGFTEADEAFFEELEESLILADLGLDTAMDAVEKLRVRVRKEKLQDQESVKAALRDVLAEEMAVGETALNLSTKPSVVLFIGVNGVGKTTSIGKLAHRLKGEGKRVLLCAADTFRAAAADQLQIWAERAGCELVRQHEGADPGAVLFDALQAAKARNVDVVLCDTAGRLHNKANLMAELHKLSKIIDRECPGCARETLLVLDATTGQNGLIQARTFQETAGLTGIVLTKLDGTAKGGIVVAIAKELGVPVKLAGVGESLEDLRPFDAREYVEAII